MGKRNFTVLEFPIPCSFAKANRDGTIGQHKVTMVLDFDEGTTDRFVIKSIHCDCMKKYSEDDLEAFCSETTTKMKTCYSLVHFVRSTGFGINRDYANQIDAILFQFSNHSGTSHIIESMLKKTSQYQKHRTREIQKGVDWYRTNNYRRAKVLNNIAQDVAGTTAISVDAEITMDRIVMRFCTNTIAEYTNGKWNLLSDVTLKNGVLGGAIDKYFGYVDGYRTAPKAKVCPVCWQPFERWDSHIGGTAHSKACSEATIRALKATTTKGISLYRKGGPEAFLPDKVKKKGGIYVEAVGDMFKYISKNMNDQKIGLALDIQESGAISNIVEAVTIPRPLAKLYLENLKRKNAEKQG